MRRAEPIRVTFTSTVEIVAGLALALAACAGPVGTTRVDPTIVQRDLGRSAVSTGEPSWPTRNVLFERGLFEAYADRPETALAELHKTMVASGGDPDLLFALAELSYLHGKARTKREYERGDRRRRVLVLPSLRAAATHLSSFNKDRDIPRQRRLAATG